MKERKSKQRLNPTTGKQAAPGFCSTGVQRRLSALNHTAWKMLGNLMLVLNSMWCVVFSSPAVAWVKDEALALTVIPAVSVQVRFFPLFICSLLWVYRLYKWVLKCLGTQHSHTMEESIQVSMELHMCWACQGTGVNSDMYNSKPPLQSFLFCCTVTKNKTYISISKV